MNTRKVKSILVVDDTEIIRDLLADVLRNDGYEVEQASDGIQAIDMLYSRHFDLVFTDMHMPRQNGLVTAKKVSEINPATMVVVTDSYPNKLTEAAALHNVVGTICKPFDLVELRSLLDRIEQIGQEKQSSVTGDTSHRP